MICDSKDKGKGIRDKNLLVVVAGKKEVSVIRRVPFKSFNPFNRYASFKSFRANVGSTVQRFKSSTPESAYSVVRTLRSLIIKDNRAFILYPSALILSNVLCETSTFQEFSKRGSSPSEADVELLTLGPLNRRQTARSAGTIGTLEPLEDSSVWF